MLHTLLRAAFAAFLIGGPVQAATVAVMNGDHDLFSNSTGGETITSLGHSATLYSDWGAALASGADALIIEQNADNSFYGNTGYSAAALASYVENGGRVIVLGGTWTSGSGTRGFFADTVFGYDVNFGSGPSTANRTAAAAGTTFGDDSLTLSNLSSTHPTTGALPGSAEVYYSDGNGNAWVFGDTRGSGDAFYLAWDYCCGTISNENQWFGVLDSAIEFERVSEVPLPASAYLLLAGFGGLAMMRRRKT